MKKLQSVISFLLVILVFMVSCKKYEEGPLISFTSKKERISNLWQVESATKKVTGASDADITSLYTGYSIEFEREGAYTIINNNYSDTSYTIEEGAWELLFKKEQIETVGVEKEISSSTGATIGDDTLQRHYWTILRLKEKELWVSYIVDSLQQIEYKLIPK